MAQLYRYPVPLNNEAQAAWAVASKGQGLDPLRVARAENNLRHVTEFWEPLHALILSVTVPQLQTLNGTNLVARFS